MEAAPNARVLVAGAFGLVGSATVARLVERGHRVVASDLHTPATSKAAHARIALARRDPYRGLPGEFADPWGLLFERFPGAGPAAT